MCVWLYSRVCVRERECVYAPPHRFLPEPTPRTHSLIECVRTLIFGRRCLERPRDGAGAGSSSGGQTVEGMGIDVEA